MRTTTLDKWDGKETAWLWVETGEGALLPIRYVRADCWVVTGEGWMTNSWCCHYGTIFYLGHKEDAKAEEKRLQERLEERRIRWSEQEKKTWERLGMTR